MMKAIEDKNKHNPVFFGEIIFNQMKFCIYRDVFVLQILGTVSKLIYINFMFEKYEKTKKKYCG